MVATKTFAAVALALGLALSGPAFAVTEQAHASQGAGVLELTLNNGQKWPTDEALRQGMGEIRSMLATALKRIHAGQFTTADYATLADRVQEQVDYVTANCKLPEEADRQLHVVLGAILQGVDAMRAGADRLEGARRVVLALEAYGRHFDDPNFPREQMIPVETVQKKVEDMGYEVRRVRFDDGCYKVYITEKASGGEVEAYYNPANGELVREKLGR